MRSPFRASILFALILATASLVAAQQTVAIDAVVTDRGGNRVSGLSKDAFEILEQGKLRPITSFAAVPPADAAGEAAPRAFFLFVDSEAIEGEKRAEVAGAVRKFIETQIRPTDRVWLLTWGRGLRVAGAVENDRTPIFRALEALSATGGPSALRQASRAARLECIGAKQMFTSGGAKAEVAYTGCIHAAESFASDEAARGRQILGALDVALRTTSDVREKKILIVVGGDVAVRPGFIVYNWANQLFAPLMRGFDAANAQPPAKYVLKDAIDRVGRHANAAGVTMYTIDVIVPPDAIDNQTDFVARTTGAEAFDLLAKATGGLFERTADVGSALDEAGRDLGSYYTLGFQPAAAPGQFAPLVVRTKDRGSVRAPQSWGTRSADEIVSDRVLAHALGMPLEYTLGITVGAGKPEPNGAGFNVPISVSAPATAVTLKKDGENLTGGFRVCVAVGNESGAASDSICRDQPVSIAATDEAAFRAEPVNFNVNLTVRPGMNLVSVAFRDLGSDTVAYARARVVGK